MTKSNRFLSARLIAAFSTIAFGTPLAAETLACEATLASGSIAHLSATHATVDTSILIDAPVEEVWATLTNFEEMPTWSTSTLQSMSGDIRDGGSVTITFIFGVDENGAPNIMEIPHTLIFEDGKKFGWSDPFSEDIGGGHDNHIYQVEACGMQTRFVQSDEIVGNPYAANFAAQLMPMYQTFNSELKNAVEN